MEKDFEEKINLILEKKFEKKLSSGYDPEDVDLFLDKVIDFIKEIDLEFSKFKNEILSLTNEKQKYAKRNDELMLENETLKKEMSNIVNDGYGNINLMSRINNLEEKLQNIENVKSQKDEIKKKEKK